jgi:outer membrane immunogenic protein
LEIKLKNIFCAAAAMIAITTTAQASDLVEHNVPDIPVPPPTIEQTPAPSWTGPYIGFHGGAGRAEGEFDGCGCGALSGIFSGRRIGAFAGYNWELSDHYVAGIEGDVDYDWNGKSFAGAERVGTDLSGSARVRLGRAVGNVLLYVAGGWTATNAYVVSPNAKETASGWTLGAGVDWAATEKMFVRAEYRYNNFSSVNLASVTSKFDQDVINVGVGIKF